NSSPSSKFSLEYFVKDYSQYPISILDGVSMANKGGDFEVFGNEDVITSGKGKSSGIEFLFQQKLSNNFYGIFSYTNFKSEFTDINSNYLPSVWDSKHLISFTGGYKLKKNWEVSTRWRFSGKTPYVPYDLNLSTQTYPEMILDYSRLGEVKLANFSLMDIRFDKKWNREKYSFNFYLDIQNFLGQKIPIPPKFGLERNELFEVILPRNLVQVDISNGSVIPSFGFIVDF
ncbi:TonB-dependent receptor, partial [Flavobacteriaceae bacterium]|nr:TonB-dependent receptor [Flavobacteriaceae bacterium]